MYTRNRAARQIESLERDPEKWAPVFGKAHAIRETLMLQSQREELETI
jgi:hypothetical protein